MAGIDLEGAEGMDIPNSVLNRIIAVKEEHVRISPCLSVSSTLSLSIFITRHFN